MSGDNLTELDRMLIEAACSRLINRFVLCGDSGDYAGLASLFTADASFARPSAPDKPTVGRDAIAAALGARPPQIRRHVVANTVITVESATSARGESCILLYTGPVQAEGIPVADAKVLIGAFHDTFVKQDGEWLFSERKGSLSLTTTA